MLHHVALSVCLSGHAFSASWSVQSVDDDMEGAGQQATAGTDGQADRPTDRQTDPPTASRHPPFQGRRAANQTDGRHPASTSASTEHYGHRPAGGKTSYIDEDGMGKLSHCIICSTRMDRQAGLPHPAFRSPCPGAAAAAAARERERERELLVIFTSHHSPLAMQRDDGAAGRLCLQQQQHRERQS
ncbi:uncharacterized protein J3D65DRAFT_391463 [Phyllosticta citribraziliensis]|uniref:Secreted protein n=1 Tax=Phyllosticta citribraziliensis TaxID=989973 RepID=A0ABR1LKV8_9PEZI